MTDRWNGIKYRTKRRHKQQTKVGLQPNEINKLITTTSQPRRLLVNRWAVQGFCPQLEVQLWEKLRFRIRNQYWYFRVLTTNNKAIQDLTLPTNDWKHEVRWFVKDQFFRRSKKNWIQLGRLDLSIQPVAQKYAGSVLAETHYNSESRDITAVKRPKQ